MYICIIIIKNCLTLKSTHYGTDIYDSPFGQPTKSNIRRTLRLQGPPYNPPTLQTVQSLCILPGHFLHLLRRNSLQRPDGLRHIGKIQRGVPFSPVRNRRQIRTVGFQNQTVKGRVLHHFLQLLRILKGDNAADSQEKSHIQVFSCHHFSVRKAMNNTADITAVFCLHN